MPRKSDGIPINNEKLDRRVKLSTETKVEIKINVLSLSHNELARKYGVSKRTIQFILDPQKKLENLQRRKERGGYKQYYDREKNTIAQREHRDYKKQLFKEGKIS